MSNELIPVNPTLVTALVQTYPQLEITDIANIVNLLTEEIGNGLLNGDTLAFMKQMPDGDVKLRVLEILPKDD